MDRSRLAVDTIHCGERERSFYCLGTCVVMPTKPVPVITRRLKASTARRTRKAPARPSRRFWQNESCDRQWNPVSAGLADSIQEWPWSRAALTGEIRLRIPGCGSVPDVPERLSHGGAEFPLLDSLMMKFFEDRMKR